MGTIRYQCPKCKKQFTYTSRKRTIKNRAETKCKNKKCNFRIYVKKCDIRFLNSKSLNPSLLKIPLTKSHQYGKNSQIENYLMPMNLVKKSAKNSIKEKMKALTYVENVGMNSNLGGKNLNKNDMFGIHRVRFKMKMKYLPPNFKWDKLVKMKGNWFKGFKYYEDHVMVKNKYYLEFILTPSIFGHNPEEIYQYACKLGLNFFIYCERELNFKLSGEMIPIIKEHLVVPFNATKDISKLGKYIILKDSIGDFMVDSSHNKEGELEINGVDKFRKLMKMANNYDEVNTHLDKIVDVMVKLGDQISKQNMIIDKQHKIIFNSKEKKESKKVEKPKEFKDTNMFI